MSEEWEKYRAFADIDPVSIERTSTPSFVFVRWDSPDVVPNVFMSVCLERSTDVNNFVVGTWYIDRRGRVFVRCLSCEKIYEFDRESIHPLGIGRLHCKYPDLLEGCYACPNCTYVMRPYFEGWEECLKKMAECTKSTTP